MEKTFINFLNFLMICILGTVSRNICQVVIKLQRHTTQKPNRLAAPIFRQSLQLASVVSSSNIEINDHFFNENHFFTLL